MTYVRHLGQWHSLERCINHNYSYQFSDSKFSGSILLKQITFFGKVPAIYNLPEFDFK